MKPWEKDLLRFALADHAFQEADALAAHIIESKLAPDSHLLSASIAGVVVCYCRPFMSASGLGPLPKSMAEFSNEKGGKLLLAAHNMIIEARQKFAAHFDRTFCEEQHAAGILPLSPSEVRVDLERKGFTVSTHSSYLNPNNVPLLRILFGIQQKRVKSRLGAIAVELLKEHRKIGTFVFKVP